MKILVSGLPLEEVEKLETGTALFAEEFPNCTEALEIQVDFWDKSELAVARNGNQISIACKEMAHYYRGLNQVFHHLKERTYEKKETVYFERNGFMLDCSRNAVFTVEKVKWFIRVMAKLGMNVLMLYTEDTYEIPDDPYFGIYRGRYTKKEIQEMDAYAKIFGIELVPCIQTLAHLHNALKWPNKNTVKDTADILQVGNAEVSVFIEKMLRSVKEAFSTRRVHLGMDEAVQLGLGKYLKENGYQKSSTLIREHCAKVLEICKKLDMEPMIWSDMYITANSNGGYYEVAEHTDCTSWEKPQPGLGLVYWDYYHKDEKIYEKMLHIHKQLSENVIFAGGSWIWNGISPNYSRTFACTKAALQTCKQFHIKEIFCTAWLDNGAETPVDAVLPGMVLFAHLGFHQEYEQTLLEEEFFMATGGHLNDFLALDSFDALFLEGKPNQESQNPSKYLLYQDPMLGMFDVHVSDLDTKSYYQMLEKRMDVCAKNSSTYKKLFAFYEKLAAVLAKKADLGVRLKSAYEKTDLLQLKEICKEEIPEIIRELKQMKNTREELWMADAKPFGYELLDIKIGGVIIRLESTCKRLEAFLDGSVTHLGELEADRISYFRPDMEYRENRWDRIISGADINDTI